MRRCVRLDSERSVTSSSSDSGVRYQSVHSLHLVSVSPSRAVADEVTSHAARSFAGPQVTTVGGTVGPAVWIFGGLAQVMDINRLRFGSLPRLAALSVLSTDDQIAIAWNKLPGGWQCAPSTRALSELIGPRWREEVFDLGVSLENLVHNVLAAEPMPDTEGLLPDLSALGLRRRYLWSTLEDFVDPVDVPMPGWYGLRRWCDETAPLVVGNHRAGTYGVWDRAGGEALQQWPRTVPGLFAAADYLKHELQEPEVRTTRLGTEHRAFVHLRPPTGPPVPMLVCLGELDERAVIICAQQPITRYVRDDAFAMYVVRSHADAAGTPGVADPAYPIHYAYACDTWDEFLQLVRIENRVPDDTPWRAIPPSVGALLVNTCNYLGGISPA
jgi:hypothetical protein